jgi:hypothetical protein
VPDLEDADAVAVVIGYLNSLPAVTEILGGSDRISDRNEPPYPHLKVTDTPGGSDRGMRWLIAQELTLELYGDMDGSPGKADLRRGLVRILTALRDLPDVPAVAGQPVVTSVETTGAFGFVPEPTGQPRYIARRLVYLHPPHVTVP